MAEQLKGYKKRLETRRVLAKKIGHKAMYIVGEGYNGYKGFTYGKEYPRPLFVLLKMLRGEM